MWVCAGVEYKIIIVRGVYREVGEIIIMREVWKYAKCILIMFHTFVDP